MSEFRCEVVRIGEIRKHENADNLEISNIHGGFPVIMRSGSFSMGELAVYIPADALLKKGNPLWDFMFPETEKKNVVKIKPKKLRGIFSLGIILPLPDPTWEEGRDVAAELDIEKYEPPEPARCGGESERDPGIMPKYTDIESLRRFPGFLDAFSGEYVLNEKVHGSNLRIIYHEDRLWVGSHTQIKKNNPEAQTIYWRVVEQYKLEEKLARFPGIALYAEVFGSGVQDLTYGIKKGLDLILFDVFDTAKGKYLDYEEFISFAKELDLPTVPLLYKGPWLGYEKMKEFAEGKSSMADHVREGFVVKPVVEFWNEKIGRVVLKMVGEGYHMRKSKEITPH